MAKASFFVAALVLLGSLLLACNGSTGELDFDAMPPSMVGYARLLNRDMESRLQFVERTLQLWLSLHRRRPLLPIMSTRARLPWLLHAAFSDDNPMQTMVMTTEERKAVESGVLEMANEIVDTNAVTGTEEEAGLTQQEILSLLDRAIAASISSSPDSETFAKCRVPVKRGNASLQ